MAAIHYTSTARLERSMAENAAGTRPAGAGLFTTYDRTLAPCVPSGRKGTRTLFTTTDDRELVTCKRCLKHLERLAAERAESPEVSVGPCAATECRGWCLLDGRRCDDEEARRDASTAYIATTIPAEEPAPAQEEPMTDTTTETSEEARSWADAHEVIDLARTIALTTARRMTPADLGLITTAELAALLGVSERHARRLPDIEPVLDLGGSMLYLADDATRLAAHRELASMAGAVHDAIQSDAFLELAARAGEHHDAGLAWDEAFAIAREELDR